jgi:hypothetical protein
VGKTSIANRFADDKFAQTYKQTVGVDFFMRRLQMNGELQWLFAVVVEVPRRYPPPVYSY